jgi:hypothetical protein
MTPAELEKNSDVVARVRVLAVACTGRVENKRTGQMLPSYQAWLKFLKVKKGGVKENQTVLVFWNEVPTGPRVGIGGAPPVRYYPGEEVLTHLKWQANLKMYGSTYYNARGKPDKSTGKVKLPTRPGEVLIATKE